MTKCYFVTGTDTEVGKTVISVALLQAARRQGYTTAGYKPVASGSKVLPEGLRNGDALLLQSNSSLLLDYQEVNPYTFIESTSPHIVSAHERKPIDFVVLSTGLRTLKHKSCWILVEGIGGWFTPISDRQTFADWVILEQIPVILVVSIKLGCINHAILTTQAIVQSGLPLKGWIANNVTPPIKRYIEYITTLKNLLPAPLIGEVPWLGKEATIYADVSNYLDISTLCL